MLNWNFDILKLQKALGEHFSVIPAQFHTADHHHQSSPNQPAQRWTDLASHSYQTFSLSGQLMFSFFFLPFK